MSKSPKSLDIANLRYFLRYFRIFENLRFYISISYLFISIEPLTINRILAVIFLSNAVYPNLQDPSPARLSAMFRACLVSTAVYPNCIEATEFRGCILGYLRNTTEKIPPNAANRPPNQRIPSLPTKPINWLMVVGCICKLPWWAANYGGLIMR